MKAAEFIDALQGMPNHVIRAAGLGLRDALVHDREPDVLIGGAEHPYMRRWWVVPRNKYEFNIYLHHFLRSDDDRALHSHPWANISFLIEGDYIEHVPRHMQNPSGETIGIHRREGEIAGRGADSFHRIELIENRPVWTLFFTGPKVQEWGFACKHADGSPRIVPWQQFTGQNEDNGPVRIAERSGPGCGEFN